MALFNTYVLVYQRVWVSILPIWNGEQKELRIEFAKHMIVMECGGGDSDVPSLGAMCLI